MDEKINEISMTIILHAGDARKLVMEALSSIGDNDFQEADNKLVEAKKKINLAHRAQTTTIQSEASGEKQTFSLLFAHAQDTLMTISSEWNIAKKMIEIFEKVDKRLERLENEK
ncbi:PTS lactose/cellobiose transporter subunit IIA [Vagococcus lutrae]|uniref:PTS lactose/cellobiose transporter subunit IIA n=1 Tax=Vagococcus lutrae TaxID=81947 RepID=A0AAF0BBP3_9ENTE|nr:PTS lactose/cellobiose transporter subunit IIA [Vagococcus lutrae]RST92675.1 PTS lactose/cellobiose transporter subunit IIA [Vagococcus lutrae]WCG21858.1 PTS lactose/cellobiose transporter subunit IIA [Vagococcus lutrae]